MFVSFEIFIETNQIKANKTLHSYQNFVYNGKNGIQLVDVV